MDWEDALKRHWAHPPDTRQPMCLAGRTVVASLRKHDADFVAWAKANDRFVRIDRKTKWGNPFKLGKESERDDVIAKYRDYLKGQPELLAALPTLKGKVLGCWCYPKACHGNVLAELADET